MLSNEKEKRTFSNGPLRDQWEKRAQSIADQCKQDEEFKQKSALKVLFSKWTYHWSVSSAEMSDFSKLNRNKEEEEKKPKIRFKIGPPPPKPKPEPPPAPPPRRQAPPKSRRPKRKVEVDVFGLCWKESWKSLKPPKYLYLKPKESKSRISRFTCIEVSDNRKYKATITNPDMKQTDAKWSQSWKQVKSLVLKECSEDELLPWEIIFERKLTNSAEIENYSLPLWARTWKYINFAFRQEKQMWDCIWPIYQQNIFAETQNLQIDKQVASLNWKDSWKLHPADFSNPADDTTAMVQVFQPGWKRSWLFSSPPLDEKEELNQDWWSCWGYWQLLRWCKASWESHRRYSDMLTRRRKSTNIFLTLPLNDEFYTREWVEAWRSPKGSQRSETHTEFETEEEEDEEETKEKDKDMDEITEKYAKKVKAEEDDEDKVKVDDDLLEEVEDEDEDEDDSDAIVNDGEHKEGEKEDRNQDNEKSDEDNESNEEDEDEEEEEKDQDAGKKEEELDTKERRKEAVEQEDYEEENKNEEELREEDEAEEEDEAVDEGDEAEDEDAVVDEEDEAEKDKNDGEVNLKEKELSDQQDKVKVSEDEVRDEEQTIAITTKDDKETAPEKQKDKKEKMNERLRIRKRNVPLHLQFHKLNKTLSSWTHSWILALPYRGDYEQEDDEEDDELSAWKDSWKICHLKKQEDDVVFLYTERTSPKLIRLTDEEDKRMKNEWMTSWKMNQTSVREEGDEEEDDNRMIAASL
ncbi:golgin subfamily A member 6-like protein 7 [Thalassophryne amazonica]|uniref:golgin subfamily A member 6-like protein 7 n=1 Tax=Thalassophryne amazonica TaxID=390379 RepID=UPI0014718777|nr:golgin subfamily A member 6-like protein 7 [Thalassophryne amazonica]